MLAMTHRASLSFHAEPDLPAAGVIALRHAGPMLIAAVGSNPDGERLLRSAFRVAVVGAEAPAGESVPYVHGRYRILDNEIQFVPHFPFVRGVRYRALFDPPESRCGASDQVTLDFAMPSEPFGSAAEVTRVFPSDNLLPLNVIRFYVEFSAPMRRGHSRTEISILDSDGRPVSDVLYRAPLELWDRSMRCITVLLDPGRLKRGVGPNVALEPPLVVGSTYTLSVGVGMIDAAGRQLARTFAKHFRVTSAVRKNVAVERWAIALPTPGSRRPLVLTFLRSLDRALLPQAITIESPDGTEVDGQFVIDRSETRCRFTPTSSWQPGLYLILVASWLEDVCGNTPVAAFDRPLRPERTQSTDTAPHAIEFQIENSS